VLSLAKISPFGSWVFKKPVWLLPTLVTSGMSFLVAL
jgi:hypothetical protein